ncbi:MAG: hypothetical protein ACYDCL_01225 [Myxococcales bacterium]
MKSALSALPIAVLAACSGAPKVDAGFNFGCQDDLVFDAGALGSATQVFPIAHAAAKAWKNGLYLTALTGIVGADGTDSSGDGGWTFTFGSSPSTKVVDEAGLAVIKPLANETTLTGFCGFGNYQPPVFWTVDSSAAFAIASDAGCPLALENSVTLEGISARGSPFYGIDPAWLIGSHLPDGGLRECVVDAATGEYGAPPPPDAGLADAGLADAGLADAGTDAGTDAG